LVFWNYRYRCPIVDDVNIVITNRHIRGKIEVSPYMAVRNS
jgi:hypothetical protein